MKLLLVIDSLGSGGAQRQLVTLAQGFSQLNHIVEVFVYHPQLDHFNADLESVGIRIHSCQRRGRSPLHVISCLRRILREGNYDVCLAFLIAASLYAELACLGLRNTKLIVSERFMYPPGRMPSSLFLLQQAHRLADHITVNSHHQRQRMTDRFPWMSRMISTIYNGVDLTRFNAPYTRNDNSIVRLLSLGSVVPKKNAHNLIDALSLVHKEGKNIIISWAGKVSDVPYYEDCVTKIRSKGLLDHWEWLGEKKDIPNLLKEYDAVIHPSFFEGLPNAICEALATSRPVLASNVCDHSILVADGIRGFLFEPDDPQSIASAIRRFAELSVSERLTMSTSARDFAESKLSNHRLVAEYAKLAQLLIEQQVK